MKGVYALQSIPYRSKRYTGVAERHDDRLASHYEGKSPHTSKLKPWKLVVAIRFEEDRRALEFERDLKGGTGFSFAKRHFWQPWMPFSRASPRRTAASPPAPVAAA